MMDEFLDFLAKVTSKLDSAGIPYMITGSMASTLYAIPRMTRDIDIVVELSPLHTERLITLFQEDSYLDPETIRQAVRRPSMFNIIDEKTVIKIDFIVRKLDEYRRVEFSRRRPVEFHETTFCVVAPEDLILSKLVWASDSESELQLRDVKQLLQAFPDLDFDYLNAWARQLHVDQLLSRVQNHA